MKKELPVSDPLWRAPALGASPLQLLGWIDWQLTNVLQDSYFWSEHDCSPAGIHCALQEALQELADRGWAS